MTGIVAEQNGYLTAKVLTDETLVGRLQADARLSGRITINGATLHSAVRTGYLTGTIQSSCALSGTIHANGITLQGHIQAGLVVCQYYEGAYDIIPKIESQVMNTAGKHMREDVTITAIPYYEVSNVSDGYTAIIGGDN